MKKTILILSVFMCKLLSAQITLLDSFNPSEDEGLCGIGYDAINNFVWVFGCSDDNISRYSPDGTFSLSLLRPGEDSDDADLDVADADMNFAGTAITAGQLLFINGEDDEAEIYAIQTDNTILDTLMTNFGDSHVVGGSVAANGAEEYFLVQDNVAGDEDENRIAHLSATGDILATYFIGNDISVNYGDLDVDFSGNLFVVSNTDDSIAQFSPTGEFFVKHDLPDGVINLSGLALDCNNNEAWACNNGGMVYHLGNFPCEPIVNINNIPEMISVEIYPNPFSSDFNIHINLLHTGQLNISLLNLMNQELLHIYNGLASSGNFYIPVNETRLNSGFYIVKISFDDTVISRKIVSIQE